MTGKIAVIGDGKSISCFRTLGISTFETGASSAGKKLVEVVNEGYSIIYITEQAAEQAQEAIERYQRETYPVVILIPSGEGSTGAGKEIIARNIEKAIGRELYE